MTDGLFRWFGESRHGGVGNGHGVLTLPRLHGVVLRPVVVGIKELLKPLDKLKVVLELALHQFVYRNDLKAKRDESKEQEVWTYIFLSALGHQAFTSVSV